MKVTVVGRGVIGLCIARSLVQSGAQVTMIDPRPPDAPRASSDFHRLIRSAYGSMTGYQSMAFDAFGAWDRLWADIGQTHYAATGAIILGDPKRGWVADSVSHLPSTECQPLPDPSTLIPGYESVEAGKTWFIPSAGILFADRILASLRDVVASCPVIQQAAETVVPSLGEVRLSDGALISSDHVVVATGAWGWPEGSPTCARRPSRQTALYLSPASAAVESPFLLDLTPVTGFYYVPPVAGYPAKLGTHTFSLKGHPDENRACTADEVNALREIQRRFLPFTAMWREVGCVANYYDVTPDQRFICETRGRSTWLGGFSGHGFKFAPLIGERVAQAVCGELTAEELARWMAGGGGLAEGQPPA